MNATVADASVRDSRLRALGVRRLRLRPVADARTAVSGPLAEPTALPVPADPQWHPTATPASASTSICRLALQADPAERGDPAIDKMYVALTEAVAKAGLQPVRVCDVAGDESAAVMVFGIAPVPDGVPAVRVLRAEPLTVLHADRECKRRLWEQLLALGRGGGG